MAATTPARQLSSSSLCQLSSSSAVSVSLVAKATNESSWIPSWLSCNARSLAWTCSGPVLSAAQWLRAQPTQDGSDLARRGVLPGSLTRNDHVMACQGGYVFTLVMQARSSRKASPSKHVVRPTFWVIIMIVVVYHVLSQQGRGNRTLTRKRSFLLSEDDDWTLPLRKARSPVCLNIPKPRGLLLTSKPRGLLSPPLISLALAGFATCRLGVCCLCSHPVNLSGSWRQRGLGALPCRVIFSLLLACVSCQ